MGGGDRKPPSAALLSVSHIRLSATNSRSNKFSMMRVPTLLIFAARATHSLSTTRIMNVAIPKLPSGGELVLCEGLDDAEDDESVESLDELFSVGGTVWPCAAALCRWLSDNRKQVVSGANVLELGGGTGACGLFAAACGAAHVTLTDSTPRLLTLMERNCERNMLVGNLPSLGKETTVSFERLVWNEDTLCGGPYDLVIGSDVRLRVIRNAARSSAAHAAPSAHLIAQFRFARTAVHL